MPANENSTIFILSGQEIGENRISIHRQQRTRRNNNITRQEQEQGSNRESPNYYDYGETHSRHGVHIMAASRAFHVSTFTNRIVAFQSYHGGAHCIPEWKYEFGKYGNTSTSDTTTYCTVRKDWLDWRTLSAFSLAGCDLNLSTLLQTTQLSSNAKYTYYTHACVQYERYMSNLYCVKFLTRHTIGSTVIYRDMVKKGLKKDKSVIQRFNADKVLDKGDDREQLVLLSTNHLNASKKNITTIRMAAKSGILLGVVYLFYSLAFVAFLPFWMALFCIGAPFVLLTEVVGVLTIAVMQSFDPYYEKQMMEEILQLKLKRNLKASWVWIWGKCYLRKM